MKIPQAIISILIAVVSSLITVSFSAGQSIQVIKSVVKQVEINTKDITEIKSFILNSTAFQARTETNLEYIKEKVTNVSVSDRRGSGR
jgi:hypothetical protein